MRNAMLVVGIVLITLIVCGAVVRAGIVDPRGISGNVLWLDAGDINGDFTSDTLGDGTVVSSWVDKSTAGLGTVSQATGGMQPVVKNNILGGMPVVRFDGGDYLQGNAVLAGGDDNFTYVAVWSTARSATQAIFEQNLSTFQNSRRAAMLTLGDRRWGFCGQNNDRWPGGYRPNEWNVSAMRLQADGTMDAIEHGETAVTQTVNTGALNIGADQIRVGANAGGGEKLQGDIAQLLVYDRDLTMAELDDIGVWAENKYALATGFGTPPGVGLEFGYDFESDTAGSGTIAGWTKISGTAFNNQPTNSTRTGEITATKQGQNFLGTFEGGNGDGAQGVLESDSWTVAPNTTIEFQVGAGYHPFTGTPAAPGGGVGAITVERYNSGSGQWEVIADSTGYSAPGPVHEAILHEGFDLRNYAGETVRMRVYDTNSGGWGHINVDDIRVYSDAGTPPAPPPTHVVTQQGAGNPIGGNWRTAAVAKPYDIDGDNIYGTDGWIWLGYDVPGNKGTGDTGWPFDRSDLPDYIGSVGGNQRAWEGSNGWGFFDDPLNPGGSKQGTFAYTAGVAPWDLIVSRLSDEAFRLTVFGSIGSGGGGFLNQDLWVSLDGDEWAKTNTYITAGQQFYALFDIPAGMENVLIRFDHIGGDQSGLTGLAFDTAPAVAVIPEPGTMLVWVTGLGLVCLGAAIRRRRKSIA